MERFDAIVVGAGPAGSATAIRLARGGARVLLADRARFPRDKPCGGGLTGRAVRELPCDVSPVVEDVVHALRGAARLPEALRAAQRGAARPDDPAAAARCLPGGAGGGAGADFRDGVTVEGLTIGPDGAELTVGGYACHGARARRRRRCRTVGRARRRAGRRASSTGSRSRETVRFRTDSRGARRSSSASSPGGYGWVFPKDGHANYGVGGWATEGPRLRDAPAAALRRARRRRRRADRSPRPPAADPAHD